jgi:hypothetical protein
MMNDIFTMAAFNSASTGGIEVLPTNYIYVGKNGNDSTGNGSANKPYLTIQKAINSANSGTTIFVFPGTYTENLTLKAGVNLTSPARYSVYVRGTTTANYTGVVYLEKIVFSSSSGAALSFGGTGVQNLQTLLCNFESLTNNNSNAIDYTNTNSGSRLVVYDGLTNVYTSTGGAKCFSSSSSSAGYVQFDKTTCRILDNINNVALNIGGAITYIHTQDQILGQVVIANSATCTFGILTMQTTSVPVLVTNSSGVTTVLESIITTTSTPAFSGAGVLVYMALIYVSTGVGGASTLSGGAGAIPLTMAPIRLRQGTLTAGINDGTFEYNGTDLFFSKNTTRYKITMTAV